MTNVSLGLLDPLPNRQNLSVPGMSSAATTATFIPSTSTHSPSELPSSPSPVMISSVSTSPSSKSSAIQSPASSPTTTARNAVQSRAATDDDFWQSSAETSANHIKKEPHCGNNEDTSLLQWSVRRVGRWLKRIGFPYLVESFERENIDGECLASFVSEGISKEDLKQELGIKYVHFTKLLRCIRSEMTEDSTIMTSA